MPEPTIAKVTIETSGGVTVFNPKTLNINLGDSVFWANTTGEAHQPAPDGGTDTQWVAKPIPSKGESPEVTFDTVPSGKTTSFPYHCAEKGHTETGVITVNVSS